MHREKPAPSRLSSFSGIGVGVGWNLSPVGKRSRGADPLERDRLLEVPTGKDQLGLPHLELVDLPFPADGDPDPLVIEAPAGGFLPPGGAGIGSNDHL